MSNGLPLSKSDKHCSLSLKSLNAFVCFWLIDFFLGVIVVPDRTEAEDEEEDEVEREVEEVVVEDEVEVEYKSSRELWSSSTTEKKRKKKEEKKNIWEKKKKGLIAWKRDDMKWKRN